jgi:coenzyme F420-reducing hydrogenase alpha subunit
VSGGEGTRTIEVGALARVEGEGALHLRVENGAVVDLRLEIYEPPRFFEAFARGRHGAELPDLLARICGICPVAYQMSAVHALEAAWGVTPSPAVRALRRLYYAGEWIESHLLHMVFLNAPDYLGLDDGLQIARLQRAEVERALRLRKLGNRILALLGGRSVNPVGVRVGGFHRLPARAELAALADELRRARGEAEALLAWFETLPVPSRVQPDLALVALRPAAEYPMCEGPIASSGGLSLAPNGWDAAFEEIQVPHSTALHARIRGSDAPYLVGPLARLALNAERLSPSAAAARARLAPRFAAPDPAASVFARGIEVLEAIDVAVGVADGFAALARDEAPVVPRAGAGHAATEAPRGLLYIGVETDAQGCVERIRIVPPTSQNQAQIESDLRALAPQVLALPADEARRTCEAAIRDYDPCISCATHFLRLTIEEVEPCTSA